MDRTIKFQFIIDDKYLSRIFTIDVIIEKGLCGKDIIEDFLRNVNKSSPITNNSCITGQRQFTNFTDKYGSEIFEGDILAFENTLKFKKVLQNHFIVKWEDYSNGVSGWTQFSPRDSFVKVGNIYENPELLKEVEKWK